MEGLQQILDFFKTITNPKTWVVAGGILLLFFITYLLRTQNIIDLLKDIEKNTKKPQQDPVDSPEQKSIKNSEK